MPREFRYIQDPDLIAGVPLLLPSAWMVLLLYLLFPTAVSLNVLLSPAASPFKAHSASPSRASSPPTFLKSGTRSTLAIACRSGRTW